MGETYTFKYCEPTGQSGCTQLQVNNTYLGTNLENKVIVNTLGVQEWIVPTSGIYHVKALGASGGLNVLAGGNKLGGKGALVEGDIKLTQGTKLYIIVGGSPMGAITGGFGLPCGGNSTSNGLEYGCPGGACSCICVNSVTLDNRIIVSAGGGGNSGWTGTVGKVGGNAGFNGEDGLVWSENNNNVIKAIGATQTTHGIRGRSLDYPNNASYDSAQDGDANLSAIPPRAGDGAMAYGGGGGSGFKNGSGGAISNSNVGSGSAGSSYVNPTLFSNVSYQTGANNTHGQIILTKIASLVNMSNLQIHPTYMWYEDNIPLTYSATIELDSTNPSMTGIQYKINLNGNEYISYSNLFNLPYAINFSIPSNSFKVGKSILTLYIKDNNGTESSFDYTIIKEDRDTYVMGRDLTYQTNWNNSINSNFSDIGASLKPYSQDTYTTNEYSHINTRGKAEIKNIIIDGTDDVSQTIDYTRDMINYQTVDSGIIWTQDLQINKYKSLNLISTLRK